MDGTGLRFANDTAQLSHTNVRETGTTSDKLISAWWLRVFTLHPPPLSKAILTFVQAVFLSIVLICGLNPAYRSQAVGSAKKSLEGPSLLLSCDEKACWANQRIKVAPALLEVRSTQDVQTWLKKVLSPMYDQGFVNPMNKIYSVELFMSRAVQFAGTQTASLNSLVAETAVFDDRLETVRAVAFRSNVRDASLWVNLTELMNDGWLKDDTLRIVIEVNIFNGLELNTGAIRYDLRNEDGSLLISDHYWTAVEPWTFREPFAAARAIFLLTFAVYILLKFARVVLQIWQWQKRRAITPFGNKPYDVALVAVDVVLHVLIFISIIYSAAMSPLPAPYSTIEEAAQAGLKNVPRVPEVAVGSTYFSALLLLTIAFTLVKGALIWADVHSEVYRFVRSAASMVLIGVTLLPITLSFAGGYITATAFKDGDSFAVTLTRMLAGTLRDESGDSASFDAAGLVFAYAAAAILVPALCAIAVHSFAIAQLPPKNRLSHTKTGYDTRTSNWLWRGLTKMAQATIFLFSPLPRVLVYRDKGTDRRDSVQITDHTAPPSQTSLVDAQDDDGAEDKAVIVKVGASQRERALVWLGGVTTGALFLTLIAFIVALHIFAGSERRLRIAEAADQTFWGQIAAWKPKVSTLPYQTSESEDVSIPGRGAEGSDEPLLKDVRVAIEMDAIPSIDALQEWLQSVVVLRYLHPEYAAERSTVPLHNPLFAQLEDGYYSAQVATYLMTTWPSRETVPQSSVFNLINEGTYAMTPLSSSPQKTVELGVAASVATDVHLVKIFLSDTAELLQGVQYVWNETRKNNIQLLRSLRRYSFFVVEFSADGTESVLLHNHICTMRNSGNWQVQHRLSEAPAAFSENGGAALMRSHGQIWFIVSISVGATYIVLRGVEAGCLEVPGLNRRTWLYFLDALIVILFLTIIGALSGAMNTSLSIGWLEEESFNAKVPFPPDYLTIGPILLRPASAIPSILSPSMGRTLRLVRELRLDEWRRDWLTIGLSAGVLLLVTRLTFALWTLPPLSAVRRVFQVSAERLVDLALLSVIPCLFCLVVDYSILSWWTFNATLARSLVHVWLFLAPRELWRQTIMIVRPTAVDANVGTVSTLILRLILGFSIGLGLRLSLLAVLVWCCRQDKRKVIVQKKQDALERYHIETRSDFTPTVSKEVVRYANAAAKALQLRRRLDTREGEFARLVDGIFLQFTHQALFSKQPTKVEDIVARSVLAHNLTRIQQYVSDMVVLSAKLYLMQIDLRNLRSKTEAAQQSVEQRALRIRLLEQQLASLQAELKAKHNRKILTEADLRPTLLDTRAVPISSSAEQVSREELHRRNEQTADARAERLQRVRKNNQRLVEAADGDFTEANAFLLARRSSSPHRKTVSVNVAALPHEVLPDVNLAPQGERRRRKSPEKEMANISSSSNEDDFEAARQVLREQYRPRKVEVLPAAAVVAAAALKQRRQKGGRIKPVNAEPRR